MGTQTRGMQVAAVLLGVLGLLGTATQGRAASADQATDQAIQTMVEHRLERHHLTSGNSIQVAVSDHTVTLSGRVRTLAEKRRAEEQARAVDDDAQLQNQLVVEAADLSDQQIADQVAKAIRSYVFYDIFDWVDGNVQNGVLTLKGFTHEPWRVQDYGRLAENVAGVREIHNQIQALPTSIYDDQLRVALARAIYHYTGFERYGLQPYPPIHIIVDNGHVTLEGVVNTELDRTLAEQIARTRVLAFDVVNHLRVEG